MTRIFAILVLLALGSFGPIGATAAEPEAVEHISALANGRFGKPVRIDKDSSISTKALFKPPIEITIEAKTDSTNLRLGYAADQVIFNWEMDRSQLRVDGGPAGGQHKFGAGAIPTNRYVTIRWVVVPTKQSIYVDGELRYEHSGDYSKLERPVSIFSAKGSEVAVRSIKVKQLDTSGN
jgi:hypothetical protein